jgi:hypothetical protein
MRPWITPTAIAHAQILLDSFRYWLGRELLPCRSTPPEEAQQLFLAPFAVLSHGTEPDPILNYGNQTALQLWEMRWANFTQMPSRLTAEPDLQEVRSQLLAVVSQQGYVADYEGVRVSQTGQRFLIQQVTIWKVLDAQGQPCGQAATFDRWQLLPPTSKRNELGTSQA